jgi:hypothetical protein
MQGTISLAGTHRFLRNFYIGDPQRLDLPDQTSEVVTTTWPESFKQPSPVVRMQARQCDGRFS